MAVEAENELATKVQNETRVGGARSTEAPGAATPSNGAPTFQEAIQLLQVGIQGFARTVKVMVRITCMFTPPPDSTDSILPNRRPF